MKKIGLIGGTSWHSTVAYYRLINQSVNDYYHGNTNPPLWIVNLNQHEIHQLQQSDRWETIADIILEAALKLQAAGMDALALCANTPHKVVDSIQSQLRIPFLSIATAIGETIQENGWHKVGLLGTRFTMQENFIKGKLQEQIHTEVIVPDQHEQHEIQRMIVEEFSLGVFSTEAKQYFLRMIQDMRNQNAQAVILGCTEIPLLLQDTKGSLPYIDSMESHCKMIVNAILS